MIRKGQRNPEGPAPRWSLEGLAFFLDMERMLSDQALKQGRPGDALAHTGDEGRRTLR